jgi:hypothetical protein
MRSGEDAYYQYVFLLKLASTGMKWRMTALAYFGACSLLWRLDLVAVKWSLSSVKPT